MQHSGAARGSHDASKEAHELDPHDQQRPRPNSRLRLPSRHFLFTLQLSPARKAGSITTGAPSTNPLATRARSTINTMAGAPHHLPSARPSTGNEAGVPHLGVSTDLTTRHAQQEPSDQGHAALQSSPGAPTPGMLPYWAKVAVRGSGRPGPSSSARQEDELRGGKVPARPCVPAPKRCRAPSDCA